MFKIRKWNAFVALVANQFVLTFQVNFKIRTHLDVNVGPYNILKISTCNLAKCIQRQCTFHFRETPRGKENNSFENADDYIP